MTAPNIKVTVSVEDDARGRCASQAFEVPTPITPEQLYAAYIQAFQKMTVLSPIKPKRKRAA